ncbi:MAG: Chk1 protein kinase [Caeruleum heppii]|nr:MAG: Chk1 protein kinase [Caeruleum heppii]
MAVQHSQLDPLPHDLPFRVDSQTIGRGAYASIRKATPLDRPTPTFAIKFIHKSYAVKHGRLSPKQILMEVSLHEHVGVHRHIIQFFATGEDSIWRWIAMEYAAGGDLFDKIEADVGCGEDVAQVYFRQLVGAVGFCHSRGVAHRDIKPENILLAASGELKVADFGLASLFYYKGTRKQSTTMCGSPPYIAPEVLACSKQSSHHQYSSQRGKTKPPRSEGYNADQIDIWSCGVVLFVLLVGNTPWDQPTEDSYEFDEYVRTSGRSSDELWQKPPSAALSLLRGMMKVDPSTRFTLEDVRRHPWFTRPNPYLDADGHLSEPVFLATQMLENLKIDFNQDPTASSSSQKPASSSSAAADAMDIDNSAPSNNGFHSFTQPEPAINDSVFTWDRPAHLVAQNDHLSFSQPVTNASNPLTSLAPTSSLADDPSLSQFSQTPSVPLSLTQRAQRFDDIVPATALTRFVSHLERSLLLPLLSEALGRLGVPAGRFSGAESDYPDEDAEAATTTSSWIKVKTLDGRMCPLVGTIVVDPMSSSSSSNSGGGSQMEGTPSLLEVRFIKVTGDPLEWRRFFKKVVVLCKEGVWVPGEMG